MRFSVIYTGLLGILSAVGLVWAIRSWRAYRIDRWAEAHPRAQA